MKNDGIVEILFQYKGYFIIERIPISEIDNSHYEDMWDWWFGLGDDCFDDNLKNCVFEILADKNEQGQYTLDNLIINVYENIDSDIPCATIKEFNYRKSWIEDKIFR